MRELEIFDKDKRRWYKAQRGLFGRIFLKEQIYRGVTKFVTGNELIFSDCGGLRLNEKTVIPTEYQPRLRSGG